MKARILEPPIGGVTFCKINIERSVRVRRGDVYSPEREKIHPGETRKISLHIIHDIQIVDTHLWPPGERLRVVFAVTDQFAKEHRTPPLLFPLWPDWPDKDVATAPSAE